MNAADHLRPGAWLDSAAGPRFAQLSRRLEVGIKEGVLPPGAPLPPERKIAEITGLSRVTVRKALGELVRKGLIEQRQGSGTFIRRPGLGIEQSLSRVTSFTEEMAHRGITATSSWLERGVFAPSPVETATFGLAENDEVARLSRLRAAAGRPIALERAALPLDVLPNPVEVTLSLYDTLERRGFRPVRATQRISAVNLDAAEAEYLDLDEGAAALDIERTAYLGNGRAIEITRSLFRADAMRLVAELRFSPEKGALT